MLITKVFLNLLMELTKKQPTIMTTTEQLNYLENKCKEAGVPLSQQMPFALQILNHAKNKGIDITTIKIS